MKYFFSRKKLISLKETVHNQEQIIEQLHIKNKNLNDKLVEKENIIHSYERLANLINKDSTYLQFVLRRPVLTDRIIITNDWRSIRIYSLPLEKNKPGGELTIIKGSLTKEIRIVLLESFVKREKFATDLLVFLITYASKEGYKSISGEISVDGLKKQPWLLHLYKKHGFCFVENKDLRDSLAGEVKLNLY